MADAEFSWGALGESWWTASGAELNASPELVRFAASRHQGASAAAAARLAGITGTAVAVRQSGYRMLRTTTVSNLLALAAAEDAGTAGGITPIEIDAKLAKMIRSPDSSISIRAIEAHGKREAARAAARINHSAYQSPDETAAGFLEMLPDARGCAIVGLLLTVSHLPWGQLPLPIFGVIAPYIKGDFPDVWRHLLDLSGPDVAVELEKLAAAPARLITNALLAELRGPAVLKMNGGAVPLDEISGAPNDAA
jgi:hypothetical protein